MTTTETASADTTEGLAEESQKARSGLSATAQGIRRQLLEENDFAPHELVMLDVALRWSDISASLLRESETLTGRDRAARLKSAGDAATSALRHWRALKFQDPARPTRRPGRPSGDEWSAARREGARAQQAPLKAVGDARR
jgi:hypothetical protein